MDQTEQQHLQNACQAAGLTEAQTNMALILLEWRSNQIALDFLKQMEAQPDQQRDIHMQQYQPCLISSGCQLFVEAICDPTTRISFSLLTRFVELSAEFTKSVSEVIPDEYQTFYLFGLLCRFIFVDGFAINDAEQPESTNRVSLLESKELLTLALYVTQAGLCTITFLQQTGSTGFLYLDKYQAIFADVAQGVEQGPCRQATQEALTFYRKVQRADPVADIS